MGNGRSRISSSDHSDEFRDSEFSRSDKKERKKSRISQPHRSQVSVFSGVLCYAKLFSFAFLELAVKGCFGGSWRRQRPGAECSVVLCESSRRTVLLWILPSALVVVIHCYTSRVVVAAAGLKDNEPCRERNNDQCNRNTPVDSRIVRAPFTANLAIADSTSQARLLLGFIQDSARPQFALYAGLKTPVSPHRPRRTLRSRKFKTFARVKALASSVPPTLALFLTPPFKSKLSPCLNHGSPGLLPLAGRQVPSHHCRRDRGRGAVH